MANSEVPKSILPSYPDVDSRFHHKQSGEPIVVIFFYNLSESHKNCEYCIYNENNQQL